MERRKSKIVIWLILATTLLFTGVFTVSAEGQVGGRPTTHTVESASSQSLTKIVNEFGRISLSLDALGTLDATGTIQVEKPAGATVRKAYLMTATTGWSNYRLSTGDVKILGNDVVWEKELSNSIVSYNYWANVTAIIKATLDAAPSGIVNLDISELSTGNIDGEILAVIFDDPNQTTNNTVLLYFGAQNVSGDSFVIDFGTPIVKDDPKLVLDYSLGISFGCQGGAGCAVPPQYSIIDVNGSRLTSAAGGEDDGFTQNGALITVGGIDDNNDNPPDPNAVPVNQYSDDELYNLKSFVNDGDTSVTIDTVNPSNDDNIFFAAVFLGSTRNVVSVDVDISLYNNPSTTEARAPYENIIKYMADGIYEASNGAHKLGKVTFYPDGENSNQAEVVWVEKCHPNANVAGFGTNGLHVNMCDIFKDGNGLGSDYNFLSSDSNQKGGGYTLAHEWGHFYYSLYDEYVGGSDTNSIFHFPHSTDKAVLNAIMNSQWNAIGGDFNWLNFSTAKNDTKETAQYRVYQASGWETLVRPVSDDPRDGDRVSLPGRLYHAELKDVAPGANESPAIDLPGTAQSALSIVWESTSSLTSPSTDTLSLPFNVQLNSILGQNLSYPNPILLLAFVHQDLMITDMGVAGSIKLPDGTTKPVVFTDDGVPPDAEKGDGLYSAILGYEEGGRVHRRGQVRQ